MSDDTSADSDGQSSSSKKHHKVKLPRPSKSMFFFKKHDDDDSRSEHSRERTERTSHPGDGHQLRAARSFNKPDHGIFHKAATSNHFDDSNSIHRATSHSTLPSGDEDDTLIALAHKAKKSSKNIIGKVFREYPKPMAQNYPQALTQITRTRRRKAIPSMDLSTRWSPTHNRSEMHLWRRSRNPMPQNNNPQCVQQAQCPIWTRTETRRPRRVTTWPRRLVTIRLPRRESRCSI